MTIFEMLDMKDDRVCESCEAFGKPCTLVSDLITEIDEQSHKDPKLALVIVEETFSDPQMIPTVLEMPESTHRSYNSLKKHYQALIEIEPSLPQS